MITRRTLLLSPLIPPLAALGAGRPPNLLIFTSREWRAQSTPWAGDLDLVAPNLKKFGAESLVFSRAYCAYPRSTPARSALITGRFPHATGVTTDGSTLPEGVPTLGETLKAAGYRTDFDAPPEKRTALAIRFLEQNQANPFFLLLESAPRGMGFFEPKTLHIRENVPSAEEPKSRAPLSMYYSVCSAIDQDLGRLLDALDRLKLSQDTIVVFTSDHGTQIGSQGIEGDDTPFEESARIPLAVRWPGAIKSGETDMPVSQVDLMPTLLTMLGQSIPEKVQGRDLSAPWHGDESHRPESIYAEGRIGDKEEWRMVVRGLDKIVVNTHGEITHLYNLAGDPYELTDLARDSSEPLKTAGLLALVKVWMRQVNDGIDPSGLKKRS